MSDCHSFDVEVAKDAGINAAIIFKSFCFWLKKNHAEKVNIKDGCVWSFASIKGLKELFPYLSEKQIRTAVDLLVEKTYLKKAQLCDNKVNRTMWYSLDEKGKCICQLGQLHSPSRANGTAPQGKCNLEDKEKKIRKEDISTSLRSVDMSVDAVFNHWKLVMKSPRSRLDSKRKKLIGDWLKTYSIDDLKQAITGCSLTPHNMGGTNGQKYNSIELILRNAGQIERFMCNAESPPVTKSDDILDYLRQPKQESTFIDITPSKETPCLKIL